MTEIERKIQDAEIEISLAIGILEWTSEVASKTHIVLHFFPAILVVALVALKTL